MTDSSLRSSKIGGVLTRTIFAALVFGVALLLAPEDPRAQATICQRHHSFDVCRVW
ncbi:MAG: hypothetical protein ACJ0GM_00325 [Parasynechococcus sp.]|jgi:hypothetical protein